MTAYETLQTAVADSQGILNQEKAKLVSLQNDPNYLSLLSKLSDPRVAGNPNGWIDGSGIFWVDSSAAAAHHNASQIVTEHKALIDNQVEIVAQAQKTFEDARKALIDYEKNSPIGQQTAQSIKDAESKKGIITVVIVIAIAVVVVVGIISYIRKRKKATQ